MLAFGQIQLRSKAAQPRSGLGGIVQKRLQPFRSFSITILTGDQVGDQRP